MNRRELLNKLRRMRMVAWIIILLIGIVFMILAYVVRPHELEITGVYIAHKESEDRIESDGSITLIEDGSFDVSDAFLSIGTGIIASSLVTLLLIALLIDDAVDNLSEEWGIEHIYEKRSDCKINEQTFPKRHLDIIAFGLSHFRHEFSNNDIVLARINSGLCIRIITLHCESPFIQEQERFEDTRQIQRDILELSKWVKEINSKIAVGKSKIEIKYYSSLPLHFYSRQDDRVYVGPYLPSIASNETITSAYSYSGRAGQYYANIFESIWRGETAGIRMLTEDYTIIKANQTDAISHVLDHFATLFRGDSVNMVRGVVVVFRGLVRKTFYSTSLARGKNEGHAVHNIEAGAIERLRVLNKNAGEDIYTILFKDYVANYSVKQIVKVNRGTSELRHDGQRKDKIQMPSDNTKYILLAPLIISNKMIGAVTFDFESMSTEYKSLPTLIKDKKENTVLSGKEVKLLNDWFDNMRSCKTIMEKMVGHYILSDYNELEGGNWDVKKI